MACLSSHEVVEIRLAEIKDIYREMTGLGELVLVTPNVFHLRSQAKYSKATVKDLFNFID